MVPIFQIRELKLREVSLNPGLPNSTTNDLKKKTTQHMANHGQKTPKIR